MTLEREVIERALSGCGSLTKAAGTLASGKDARNLWRRAQKLIHRHVLGQEAMDLFFKRGAKADLMLASRLVCDPGEITDLVVRGRIPIIDACRGLPGEKKIYQILYNRVGRGHGTDIPKQLRKKARQKPSNPFKVSRNELGQAGR